MPVSPKGWSLGEDFPPYIDLDVEISCHDLVDQPGGALLVYGLAESGDQVHLDEPGNIGPKESK